MPETALAIQAIPARGSIAHCRSHRWVVVEAEPAEERNGVMVLGMACLAVDANGQRLEVFWEREMDAQVMGAKTGETAGREGIEPLQIGRDLSGGR